MDFEHEAAEHFALEAIRTAQAEASAYRPQDVALGTFTVPSAITADTRPWHVRYKPWLIGGSALAALLIWRRWQRRKEFWPNPSRRAVLKRRAYLRALRSSELAGLQPADREHAAKALTALFDQSWRPWLKRIVAKGVSLHDAVYWLPSKPSPDLAKFLRTHVSDVPRKRPDDLRRFMTNLEDIARGWDKLEPEDRQGSVREVAKRVPEAAYPRAEHIGLSREAAAMNLSEENYYEIERRWLEAVNEGKKKRLPDIYLHHKGMTGEYVMRSLSPADPRGLFLGAQESTKCCQKPGFQAENCAWHGVESPNGTFYVMETENGDLVAMSWAWKRDRYIIFDSVESSLSVPPVPPDEDSWNFHDRLKRDIASGFQAIGETIIKTDPSISEVRIGGGYGTVAQDIANTRGWRVLKSETHGSGYQDMEPRDKLRAKVLDEAMTSLILHPGRCYSDSRYTQFIVASQPAAIPDESNPIDKIIEDPYIDSRARYRMAKRLKPSFKMAAAILGLDFTDKQRVTLASEATPGDRHNAELVNLLAEEVSPRFILPFLDAMTERQLCIYLVKHGDDLPDLFFRSPRILYDFLIRPGMGEMRCVTSRKRYGADETMNPSKRISSIFLADRVSEEALKLEQPPRGKERLTTDQVKGLIAMGGDNTLTRLMLLLTGSRDKKPMTAAEARALIRSDVGSTIRANFVSYLRQLLEEERHSHYYGSNYADFGRVIGAELNGLTMTEKLGLVYKLLDDPEMKISRDAAHTYRDSPATEFVAGFLASTRYSIAPKQLDRLLSKMLLEHRQKGYANLLEHVVKRIAESWGKELPRDLRFTMAMLLHRKNRKEILFNYADTFTKAQIYDILNIGSMSKAMADAEAKVTSNPALWGIRGVAALFGS